MPSWQHCSADTADGAFLAYLPALLQSEGHGRGHGCGQYYYADGVDCIAVTGLHGGVVVWAGISLGPLVASLSAVSVDTPDTAVSLVSR